VIDWVEIEFADGSIARFVCVEPVEVGEARRESVCEDDLRPSCRFSYSIEIKKMTRC